MKALTVSELSRGFGVSTRMLRYYEKEGLLASFRREGYAYRMYDEAAVRRLQQILILRRLRIPLREIKLILQRPDTATALEVFVRNIRELDAEIDALGTVRDILARLAGELSRAADRPVHSLLADNAALLEEVRSLALTSINVWEDQSMKHLEGADRTLRKLADVRIITLPPCTVAAAHHVGEDPELTANGMIHRFVRESGLVARKPDLRLFGFNHPNPVDETGVHGYETWVTIPADMPVPAPLAKKQFAGGLYAAHVVALGNFNEWEQLLHWVTESERYAFAGDFADQEHMCGMLDEHLNYAAHALLDDPEPEGVQFDLLMPVREK